MAPLQVLTDCESVAQVRNLFQRQHTRGPKDAVPQIKPGAAGGETAGKAFPQAVKDAAKAENPRSTCVYCRIDGTGTQVDHAIPKARGGDATLDNAQMACPHCNASKGARNNYLTLPKLSCDGRR